MKLVRALFISLIPLLLSTTAASKDSLPAVYLTHFFVALDQPSYDALRKSPEIASLGSIEERHTVAGEQSWSGFYIRGRQTYMEFYGRDNLQKGENVGDGGLALAVEQSGGVAQVAASLRTEFGDQVKIEATPRTLPTGTIPWFTSTYVDPGTDEVLAPWVMEIDPNFLTAMHPGAQIAKPLSREQYLAFDFKPALPLDNVVSLKIALNEAELTRLAKQLRLVGWTVRTQSKGFIAQGPDVKVTVSPAGAHAGIQEVDFSLRRPMPRQQTHLGTVDLVLDGKVGRLVFWK